MSFLDAVGNALSAAADVSLDALEGVSDFISEHQTAIAVTGGVVLGAGLWYMASSSSSSSGGGGSSSSSSKPKSDEDLASEIADMIADEQLNAAMEEAIAEELGASVAAAEAVTALVEGETPFPKLEGDISPAPSIMALSPAYDWRVKESLSSFVMKNKIDPDKVIEELNHWVVLGIGGWSTPSFYEMDNDKPMLESRYPERLQEVTEFGNQYGIILSHVVERVDLAAASYCAVPEHQHEHIENTFIISCVMREINEAIHNSDMDSNMFFLPEEEYRVKWEEFKQEFDRIVTRISRNDYFNLPFIMDRYKRALGNHADAYALVRDEVVNHVLTRHVDPEIERLLNRKTYTSNLEREDYRERLKAAFSGSSSFSCILSGTVSAIRATTIGINMCGYIQHEHEGYAYAMAAYYITGQVQSLLKNYSVFGHTQEELETFDRRMRIRLEKAAAACFLDKRVWENYLEVQGISIKKNCHRSQD